MEMGERRSAPDVDPVAWSVLAGLAVAVVTALSLLVTGHFTGRGLLLVFLLPGIVGSAAWLGWALRRW